MNKMKKNKYLISPDINNNFLTEIIDGYDQDNNKITTKADYQGRT